MADWSLLQPMPDFASAALSGYQAGAAMGRQKRLDAALGGVDLERPETLYPVLRADPATGAALLGTSMKMAEYKHELAGKAATSDYLIQRLGLDNSGAAAGTPAPIPVAPADATTAVNGAANSTIAPPVDPNEITVTAHANPNAARVAMIRNDPEGYIKLETSLAGMDETKQKAVQGITSTFDAALQGVRSLPYAQRRGYLVSHRDALIQAGVPAQQIDSFDPTDDNITAIDNQVLGIKGILEKQDKDRSFALQQDRFKHDVAHDSVTEAQGSARIGLEGANVGIARAHLALDQKTAAQKAGAGGGGTIATPTSKADYDALPAGARFYKNGQIRIKQ